MPFVRVDEDAFDDLPEEVEPLPAPSGAFDYESAKATFKPAKLGGIARLTLDALLAAGATTFRVRYDGGYDEGFAYPDEVRFADGARSVDAVAGALVAAPGFLAAVRDASNQKGSMYGNGSSVYAEASDATAAGYALDELAHELASRLLGDGYGTGEYQLYGALTADLRSGAIVDDPAAPKPPDLMR